MVEEKGQKCSCRRVTIEVEIEGWKKALAFKGEELEKGKRQGELDEWRRSGSTGWEDKEDGGDGVWVEEKEKLIKEELDELKRRGT